MDHAEKMQRIGIVRLAIEDFAICRLRSAEPAGAMVR
jgi:hypothetical protein